MPFGGLAIYGSGMRLQPVTPGVTDQGNFKISGTGIAGLFQTSDGNIPPTLEIYGKGATAPGGIASVVIGRLATMGAGGNSNVILGDSANLLTAGGGQSIAIGFNSGATGATSVIAIGAGCIYTSSNGNGLAIGSSCTVNAGASIRNIVIGNVTTATFTLNENTVVGCNGSITGGTVTVFGSSNSINSNSSIVIGQGNTANSNGSIILGNGNTVAPGFVGCLLIGNGLTATQPSQILIGPWDFSTTAAGKTAKVLDANFTIPFLTGRVQYSTLTAARVVTLMAAASYSAGTRITVTDFSGSCSAINTITLTAFAGDTINGLGSAIINTAYGSITLETDFLTKWVIVK